MQRTFLAIDLKSYWKIFHAMYSVCLTPSYRKGDTDFTV